MSLKEKRCFQLTPLITDREDLSSEFSGLTLPSTERTEKDCWEEENNNLEYNERNCSSSNRPVAKEFELFESNAIEQLPERPSRPQSNTTSFTSLQGYPDSPRPPGTSLFNDIVSVKKKDCKSSLSLWVNQRRKQSVAQSPKRNTDTLGRNSKRKPSLRARLINRFILSTRKAVHEYAAAATAIISPSGDLGDSDRFQSSHRYAQDGMESTDIVDHKEGFSCRLCEDHRAHSTLSVKKPGMSTSIESRIRSKSFPEYVVHYNDSAQEENVTLSRMRSCSQVLDDELYGTKSDDWLHVSGELAAVTITKKSRRMPYDNNRDFSPVSPYIRDGVYIEENTRGQVDRIQTSLTEVDEEDKASKGEEEKEEDIYQTAKYKKKMSLKLDLQSVAGSSRDSRIVPVKTSRKKGSFV
ncbi:hypothetical protein GpartN1_g4286.t1 [Galdieria partita]|uniref:Uncharacterized protein n=1 Tax=Galdieria partita TaxID=83374 RepID=A0A9C7PXY5_9RHOD|nr:hypothetical protein GpartN1_g4286.t1 [Galdieria partita]